MPITSISSAQLFVCDGVVSCTFVIGLVVFTGSDSKLMQNQRPTPSKQVRPLRVCVPCAALTLCGADPSLKVQVSTYCVMNGISLCAPPEQRVQNGEPVHHPHILYTVCAVFRVVCAVWSLEQGPCGPPPVVSRQDSRGTSMTCQSCTSWLHAPPPFLLRLLLRSDNDVAVIVCPRVCVRQHVSVCVLDCV